jgi:hypothetical protein
MPNWVDQEFVIVGPRGDLDRFCALAVTGNFRRSHTLDDEPRFLFDRVCPITKAEARDCGDEHRTAVLLQFLRSHTQASFQLQSAWTYPEHFYKTRLLRGWPTLQFCCAVNEDMGQFQGLMAGIGGVVTDHVEGADAPYNRRRHLRRIRTLKRRWAGVERAGRPWVVLLPFRFRTRARYAADATFDVYGRMFHLPTETEVRRLVRGRTAVRVCRRTRTGQLRQVRAYRRGDLDG